VKSNPFSLEFGKQPPQFISRLAQTENILNRFTSDPPESSVCMITGVRGSGKTVLMTNISKTLEEDKTWVVIELSPLRDMLAGLAGKLYDQPGMKTLFKKAGLDLSLFGIGIHLDKTTPVADIETSLSIMLKELQKKGKKVLITVDEAVNNENVRVFTSVYQILLRKDYPLFLLMTGLYENIYELQNDPSLTFLYRAPKEILEPLNTNAMSRAYASIFGLSNEKSVEMAYFTKGYSYAFQVLGYLYWKEEGKADLTDLIPDFDQYMEEYVYEKIWSELSEKDRSIISVIPDEAPVRIQEIREKLGLSSGETSVYRDRLLRKGIVASPKYGYLELTLPRFGMIIKNWMV